MKAPHPKNKEKEFAINLLLKILQQTYIKSNDAPDGTNSSWVRLTSNVLALAAEIMVEQGDSYSEAAILKKIEEIVLLEALESASTNKNLSAQLKLKISNYLNRLPGYGQLKYRESTIEHHRYIIMPLATPIR